MPNNDIIKMAITLYRCAAQQFKLQGRIIGAKTDEAAFSIDGNRDRSGILEHAIAKFLIALDELMI